VGYSNSRRATSAGNTGLSRAVDSEPIIRTSRLKQDARGVWHIHYSVPDPDAAKNGGRRSKTESTRTRDKGIAETLLEVWRDEQRQELRDAEGFTVGDAIDLYLREKGPRVVEGTRGCLRAMKADIGNMRPRDLDQDFVDAWVRTRVNRRTGQPLASGSMLRDLIMVRAALAFAAKRKKVDWNDIHDDLNLPEKGAPRTRWLDEAEIEIVWDKALASPPRVLLWVAIAMETAARKSAILGLTWDRIHLNGPVPYIDFVDPRMTARRTKRRAKVRISARLLPVLTEALANAKSTGAGNFLFRHMDQSLRVFFKRLGLPGKVTPHTLRHTWATHKIAKGASTALVAEVLGDTEEVVRRNYKHLVPENTMNIMDL